MRVLLWPALALLLCTSVLADQGPATPTTETGLATEWDVRADLVKMASDVRRLQPLLETLKPEEWIAEGASGSYVQQLRSSLGSMQSLFEATDTLAKQPERLSAAIDAYFRMERMELLLGSLRDGVRKYADTDVANQLNVITGENSVHREKLKAHIESLAKIREDERRLMDAEAQRCRGVLTQVAPEAPRPAKRRRPPQ